MKWRRHHWLFELTAVVLIYLLALFILEDLWHKI